jgi:glycosyltransferase involved in cell wall biosynthesis
LDYARYNQKILGNESVIGYFGDHEYFPDGGTEQEVVNQVKKEFNVLKVGFSALNKICEKFDFAYFQRAGSREILPDTTRTGVHAVFRYHEPHGDVYAYISRWLSWHMSSGKEKYVPYVVNLPEPTVDPTTIRRHLGISPEKYVVGRFGGYNTFDIPFVHRVIAETLTIRNDIVFVMLNTAPFYLHPNILYLRPISDVQSKANYINMCDAFLHGRTGGESFGMAIAESLFFGKPVLAYEGGADRNHVDMLRLTNLIYNEDSLFEKLNDLQNQTGNWKELVDEYTPRHVMGRFREVFLNF